MSVDLATRIIVPRSDWLHAFRDLTREHGYEPLDVKGHLPDGLAGTLIRVGPAKFERKGVPYGHWFDGDGAVTAVRLRDGRAEGAIRYLRTPSFVDEEQTDTIRYHGFGTRPGLTHRYPMRHRNPANAAVFAQQGKLYALAADHKPVGFSLDDLSVTGESDLGLHVAGLSAPPRYVPERRAWYAIETRYGASPDVVVHEIGDDGTRRRVCAIGIPHTIVRDFVVTGGHVVLFVFPVRFEPFSVDYGLQSLSKALRFVDHLPTEIVVVPLANTNETKRIEIEPAWAWQMANGWDDGDGVVVDWVRYPDFRSNHWLSGLPRGAYDWQPNGRLVRTRIDLAGGKATTEELASLTFESPRIDPRFAGRRHRYVWGQTWSEGYEVAGGQPNQMARIDTETGIVEREWLGSFRYPSEPVLAPRGPAEGDAWALSLVYDAATNISEVAVVDAARFEGMPLARVLFDEHVPLTLGGVWLPARSPF